MGAVPKPRNAQHLHSNSRLEHGQTAAGTRALGPWDPTHTPLSLRLRQDPEQDSLWVMYALYQTCILLQLVHTHERHSVTLLSSARSLCQTVRLKRQSEERRDVRLAKFGVDSEEEKAALPL